MIATMPQRARKRWRISGRGGCDDGFKGTRVGNLRAGCGGASDAPRPPRRRTLQCRRDSAKVGRTDERGRPAAGDVGGWLFSARHSTTDYNRGELADVRVRAADARARVVRWNE